MRKMLSTNQINNLIDNKKDFIDFKNYVERFTSGNINVEEGKCYYVFTEDESVSVSFIVGSNIKNFAVYLYDEKIGSTIAFDFSAMDNVACSINEAIHTVGEAPSYVNNYCEYTDGYTYDASDASYLATGAWVFHNGFLEGKANKVDEGE